MRAAASNFSLTEVKKVIEFCHKNKVKAYCTVNVIIYEKELNQLKKILKILKQSNIDAVICWDLAVISECKRLKLPVHLSTQASVSNSEAAKYWKKLGVERIVLARECSLEDIKEIKKKSKLEIEIFIHGARCISLSGRCFMSQELFNKSANRGECLQPCRREYKVIDEENKEMIMENNFVMSAKDLCALPLLPKLLSLGVDSLKIEGRNRGADYVYKVVSAYRQALTAIKNKEFNDNLINKLLEQLKEVYNKDFSRGYFVDYPHHERAKIYGSKATLEKVQIGKVSNFYSKKQIAEFKVECAATGYHEIIVEEMYNDNGKTVLAKKGEIISITVWTKVRENDRIYLLKKRKA